MPVLTPTEGQVTFGGAVVVRALGKRICPLKLKTKAPELTKAQKAAACAGLGKVMVISKVLKFTSITMPFDEDWLIARAITDLRLSMNC